MPGGMRAPYSTYQQVPGGGSPAWNTPRRAPVYEPGRMEREISAVTRDPIPLAAIYPGRDRERPAEWEPAPGLKYDRGQNFSVLAGTGGVLGLIGVYAGKPDGIDLTVTGGAAVVELQDRLGLNPIRYTLPGNTTVETLVSRERVMAFNVSDAAPATVSATGKWALPAPAVEGYRRARTDDDQVGELGLTEGSDLPEAREPTY